MVFLHIISLWPCLSMDSLTTFNDPVHKTIVVHPLCLKIIDTPEFQRLRNIRQCGICYFVYPSATHSRFEHCIGVYHLAGIMLDQLYHDISEEDKLCVKIAALCHDLGHGPFSHLWEQFVKRQTKSDSEWHHEEMSLKIFKRLELKLHEEFKKYNLQEQHLEQIKNIISGNYELIEKEKLFLFEIVANKKTNIDVDRWDYMMRDSYFFGITCPIDFQRIISNLSVKVLENGEYRIAFRDKLKENIFEIFQYRMKLHRICYKHKVCKILEIMLIDALILADDFYFEKGIKLSNCHDKNLEKYLSLDDSIMNTILYSDKMCEAKAILHRMYTRNLYPTLFLLSLSKTLSKEKTKILENQLLEIQNYVENTCGKAIRLGLIDINMGIDGEDPFKNVIFFKKSDENVRQPIDCNYERQLSLLVCSVDLISADETKNKIKKEIEDKISAYLS